MDRTGTIVCLVGLAIAFVGSLPFMASVISGMSAGAAGSLAWQAWALGSAVAFVGVGLIMASDTASPRHLHGHG
jgi:uncharacterized oligopeptide transporter (OPT) family protein